MWGALLLLLLLALLLRLQVMSLVMHQVGLPIPPFVRKDSVLLSHTYSEGPAAMANGRSNSSSNASTGAAVTDGSAAAACTLNDSPGVGVAAAADSAVAAAGSGDSGAASSWGFTFSIHSIHGPFCPLPMVASASVSFAPAANEAQDESAAVPGSATAAVALEPAELSGQLPWEVTRSCVGSWQQVAVTVDLQLVAAADADKLHQQVCRSLCAGCSCCSLSAQKEQVTVFR